MLAIQKRGRDRNDEELAAVGIGTRVLSSFGSTSLSAPKHFYEVGWSCRLAGRMRGGEKGGMETDCHAEQAGGVVLELEILVREGFGAVDAGAAGAIAVQEISALDHEIFDLEVSPHHQIGLWCREARAREEKGSRADGVSLTTR